MPIGTGAAIGTAGVGGYYVGDLANDIPIGGGRTLGEGISDLMSGVVFVQAAGRSKDFINAKVATVVQHIRTYSPPDPNDPDDQRNKKNLGDRMRKHLEAARDRLKRLKGKTRTEYEELILKAEDALETWIAGG